VGTGFINHNFDLLSILSRRAEREGCDRRNNVDFYLKNLYNESMELLNDLSAKVEAWLVWVLVTGISWIVGLVLVSVLMRPAVADLPYQLGLVSSLLVGGAMVGIIQWMVLHPEAEKIGRWMLATIAGWTLCLLLDAVIASISVPLAVGLVGGAVGGIVLGYFQWRVMVPGIKAGREWMLMTIASWMLALTLGLLAPSDMRSLTIAVGFEGVWGAGILGWSFITLVGLLILILAFPKPDETPFGDLGDWFPRS
jgi:hypothetical protein